MDKVHQNQPCLTLFNEDLHWEGMLEYQEDEVGAEEILNIKSEKF